MSWAILDLHVQEPLTVYEKANSSSKVISQLAKGDVVVLSASTYGGFRKVLVMYNGKRVGGFVPVSSLKESYIRDRDEELSQEFDTPILKRKATFGLAAGFFALYHGAKSYVTQPAVFDVGSMSAFGPAFSFVGDIPLNERWVVRPYISFRSVQLKGSARERDNNAPIVTPSVKIDSNLLGLGGVLKYFPWSTGILWFGGALEYNYATSYRATVTDQISYPVNTDKPSLLYALGAMGWDIEMGDFMLSPEIRAGAIPTAKPIMFVVDAWLSVVLIL